MYWSARKQGKKYIFRSKITYSDIEYNYYVFVNCCFDYKIDDWNTKIIVTHIKRF